VNTTPIVEARRLSKTFVGADRPAVDEVDLSIARGRIFGLLGPNGAGKTTFMSMLCGLLAPSRGEIRLGGEDVRHAPARVLRRIGLVPQDLALYPSLTPRENLAYFGGIQGLHGAELLRRIDYCLDVAGLSALADRRVDTFSGGLKRRLNLVIALIHEPELLILDEPTVGIDPQSRRFIHDNLRRLNAHGLSIIYTSHYMEEVEQLCHELAIIDHGHIIARGTVDEILNRLPNDKILLRVATPLSLEWQARLRAIEGVERASFDGHAIMLECHTPQSTLARTLEVLQQGGITVASVSLGAVDLEQVFISLTGNHLRDAP
jgi:linearmycin/streptolysin S transport system ATP-binding protein